LRRSLVVLGFLLTWKEWPTSLYRLYGRGNTTDFYECWCADFFNGFCTVKKLLTTFETAPEWKLLDKHFQLHARTESFLFFDVGRC
jgi:hypothetical protein